MKKFINIYLSYMKTAIISMVIAIPVFSLASVIHNIAVYFTGNVGTSIGILSFMLAALILIATLLVILPFNKIPASIYYYEMALFNYRYKKKKKKTYKELLFASKMILRPNHLSDRSLYFYLIEHIMLRILLGFILFRAGITNIISTLMETERKD